MTPHILIAGGGVAAVEAAAALRALAGSGPRITMLAPHGELATRASSVAAPFGLGAASALPFDVIRRHVSFDLREGRLAAVDVDAHVAIDAAGERIGYDYLLVAVGARAEPALEGAITFAGPRDAPAVAAASGRLAFVLPSPSSWPLPVYELALMAAADDRGEITLVTPEHAPLWVFGPEAGEAVSELLAARGIALRAGTRAVAVSPGALQVDPGEPVPADHVIALPRLRGPGIAGLRSSVDGFLLTDLHGRVDDDVWAAGDATAFPLKQGGLAAQQADAAAQSIAAALGARVEPEPFRPVLRGLLLTGGAPLYLRSALSDSGRPESTDTRRMSGEAVSRRALWWPPGKIAGRYIAPLLATARPPLVTAAPMEDLTGGPDGDAEALVRLLEAEEAGALQ